MNASGNLHRVSTFAVPMLLAVVSIGQPSTSIDDHGNDPSTATILNLGETATGEIDPAHDEDHFRLDLSHRTTIAISGTTEDGQSIATSLLRMEGEVETCLGIHIHGRQTTRRELPGGTYYLAVSNIQPDSGVYELSVLEAGPDDHGGMPETATELPLGTTLGGAIDPAGDTDIFRIELPERTTLEVSGVSVERSQAVRICEPEQRDFDFVLVDDDVRTADDSNLGRSRRELEPGTYYLAVRSGGLTGAYEIGVRDVGPDDHGDAPFSATPLALGEAAAGEIEPRGDLDYFRFDLPRRMDVTVSARADAGIDLRLSDANGREAADAEGVYRSTEQDGQRGLLLRAELDAGRHYLLVWIWDLDEASSGSYEVVVRQAGPENR